MVEYALGIRPGLPITLHQWYVRHGPILATEVTREVVALHGSLAVWSSWLLKHDRATLANQLAGIGHVVAALGYLLIGVDRSRRHFNAGSATKQVSDQRKLSRSSLVWFMRIMGFAVTGGARSTVRSILEARLLTVSVQRQ